jgi:hypothetical protein
LRAHSLYHWPLLVCLSIDPPTCVHADFGGRWCRNFWQTSPGCGKNVCRRRGNNGDAQNFLRQYTSTRRVSCSQGIPSRPGSVILHLSFAHRKLIFDMRSKQAPVSAPIPAATKTSVGVGIPPRTPAVSQGTILHPPIKTEETVSTNTRESSEPTTGFSSVSRSTVAALEPKDKCKDIVQSPPKAISAVFEQSLQVCNFCVAYSRAVPPSAAEPRLHALQ